jgi:hypothetical protein
MKMRIAVAVLLVVHGLIHLMGFVKAWKIAPVPQLSGATLFALPDFLARVVGLLWLVACLALVGAAAVLLTRGPGWWILAGGGVLLSQLLVIHAWPDAKAGTVANALLAVAVAAAAAQARFDRETDRVVRSLLSRAPAAAGATVRPEELAPLPAPVRRWLVASGVVGRPRARTVHLRQRGELRTAPGQAWMPAEAEQVFTADEPGFVWRVKVRMMRVLPVAGRDWYLDGRGRMLIELFSAIPLVDASDEKIDQGALLRFLGETVWFPSAALSRYVSWEPIDDTSARATVTWGGASASAVFSFDERGRFRELNARRWMGSGQQATLERWFIPATDWREMDGVVVPVKGEVFWKLKEGDFGYYRWEITALQQDPPAP